MKPTIVDALLTLCWHSVGGSGNQHVNCLFSYNAGEYIDFGVTWQCSTLIIEYERLKIVDTPLTLIHGWGHNKQPSYTESSYATNCIQVIDIQCCVSNYLCLHPEALGPLDLWPISLQVMCVTDDVALLRSCAFGWQLMPCRSFHQFLIHIARLPHRSSSSYFSSSSITYHNQLSTIWTMGTRSVWRGMQLDRGKNTAWQSSSKPIHIEYWPLLLWLVCYYSVDFC